MEKSRIVQLIDRLSESGGASEAAEALVKIGPEALHPVVATLQDRQRSTLARLLSAIVLGQLADARSVPTLINVLKDVDDSWEVRRRAAWAVGEIGDQRAEDALLDALENDLHPDIRGFAAEALGKLRSERAVPLLVLRLADMDEMDNFSPVASAAVGALGLIGGEKAEAALLEVIESWLPEAPGGAWGGLLGTLMGAPLSNEDLLCVAAAEILGTQGHPRVVPELERLHQEAKSPVVKKALTEALEEFRDRARGD